MFSSPGMRRFTPAFFFWWHYWLFVNRISWIFSLFEWAFSFDGHPSSSHLKRWPAAFKFPSSRPNGVEKNTNGIVRWRPAVWWNHCTINCTVLQTQIQIWIRIRTQIWIQIHLKYKLMMVQCPSMHCYSRWHLKSMKHTHYIVFVLPNCIVLLFRKDSVHCVSSRKDTLE